MKSSIRCSPNCPPFPACRSAGRLRFESITRAEIAQFLDTRTRETIKPEELQREEAALEFLGFIPAGFDLRKLIIDLMTEQAAAFYDYNKKALYLSDWTPEGMRDTAVVHELAHALADQNFHLGRYTRKVENSSEQTSARQAVIEGQATYLMFAFAAFPGKPSAEMHPDPSLFDQSVAPAGGQYPVFDRAPLYMRMDLIFPYTWGLAFQSALLDRMGKDGYVAPFRNPPVSTQQIIHPELYFSGQQPRPCSLPKPPHGYKVIFEGDLGELDHRILIQQFVSLTEAKRISPQWRGGAYRVVENKKDHGRMLFYVSEWADERSATAFLGDYRKCLEGKSKEMTISADSDATLRGHNSRGYFRVERTGGPDRCNRRFAGPALNYISSSLYSRSSGAGVSESLRFSSSAMMTASARSRMGRRKRRLSLRKRR